jgi:hypothetical protein
MQLQPQAIVNDPIHTVSNLVQFLQALQTAIDQTGKLANLISGSKETIESVKKITDLVETINSYLNEFNAVVGLGYAYANVVSSARYGVDMVTKHRREVDIRFATDIITAYTNVVMAASNALAESSRYMSSKFKGSDDERLRKVEEGKRALDSMRNNVDDLFSIFSNEVMERKMRELTMMNLLRVHRLSPVQAFVMSEDYELYLAGQSVLNMQKHITDKLPTPRLVRAPRIDFNNYVNLFFALSAIVLLFGAYKVFERVMFGEDIIKPIAIWGLATIFMFLIGVAANHISTRTYRSADNIQSVFPNESIK